MWVTSIDTEELIAGTPSRRGIKTGRGVITHVLPHQLLLRFGWVLVHRSWTQSLASEGLAVTGTVEGVLSVGAAGVIPGLGFDASK